jgi:hypothetical protein
MTITVDRFDEMVHAIRDSLNKERLAEIARKTVDRQQGIAFEELWDHTPQKTRQTFMTTGHESHTSIGEGWRLDSPRALPDGAEAVIRNVSEHIDVQRTGTTRKNYPIPNIMAPARGSGPAPGWKPFAHPWMVFWVGPPLKWPARKKKFQSGRFGAFSQVRHPGFGPWGGRDFVEEAADEARPAMIDALRDESREMFKPAREFFS